MMRFTNNIKEKIMTNPKLFEIANTLSKLTVLEAKELIDILENDYGIKPQQTSVLFNKPKEDNIPVVEKTEFDVYLDKVEPYQQKLKIIKILKETFNFGLKECKDLVDSTPCLLKRGMSKADIESLKNRLAEFDAKVTLK
jgi:large subunit ribosomal protein L7/L12